jgi:hypothetical protein
MTLTAFIDDIPKEELGPPVVYAKYMTKFMLDKDGIVRPWSRLSSQAPFANLIAFCHPFKKSVEYRDRNGEASMGDCYSFWEFFALRETNDPFYVDEWDEFESYGRWVAHRARHRG